MILADVLGMTWWTILMAGGGFVAGVLMSGFIKSLINR